MSRFETVLDNYLFKELWEYETRIREYYQELLNVELTGVLNCEEAKKIKMKILLTKELNDKLYSAINDKENFRSEILKMFNEIDDALYDDELKKLITREPFNRFVRIYNRLRPDISISDEEITEYYTKDELDEKMNDWKMQTEALLAIETEIFKRMVLEIENPLKKRKKVKNYNDRIRLKCKNNILYMNSDLETAYLNNMDLNRINFIDQFYNDNTIFIGLEGFLPDKYKDQVTEEYMDLLVRVVKMLCTEQEKSINIIIAKYLRILYSYMPEFANIAINEAIIEADNLNDKKRIQSLQKTLILK